MEEKGGILLKVECPGCGKTIEVSTEHDYECTKCGTFFTIEYIDGWHALAIDDEEWKERR